MYKKAAKRSNFRKWRNKFCGRYCKCFSKRRKKSIFRIKLKIIIALVSVLLIIAYCDYQIKPLLTQNASIRADAIISNAECNAMVSMLESDKYSNAEFIDVSYNNSGTVQSVECNTILLNLLMNDVGTEIENNIINEQKGNFSVHIGSLTGITSLMAKGPLITYEYDLSFNVNCDFLSHFESVGINQTKHTLIMRSAVLTTVILPWQSDKIDVINDFLIAETIIVGNVPESLTEVELDTEKLYSQKE